MGRRRSVGGAAPRAALVARHGERCETSRTSIPASMRRIRTFSAARSGRRMRARLLEREVYVMALFAARAQRWVLASKADELAAQLRIAVIGRH